MNTALDNDGQKSAGIWQNLRLVPLFSLIFGGILLLFALCIGVASYFLILSNHSLDDATDEIQVRMGLSNSSNHLRTARLTIIQAGAAARIGEMDDFRANIAAAGIHFIESVQDGLEGRGIAIRNEAFHAVCKLLGSCRLILIHACTSWLLGL